jgi:tetratricopeptide (TPR) repeat protein/AraC-like DNA-binding protein
MTEATTTDQIFVRKLTEIVKANLADENFGVKELADKSGMSLYRLNRRLHSTIKKTSNQFIREIRLQKSLEMIQTGTFTVAEVSIKTGFGSPNYFNKCFHEHFGYSPGKVTRGNANPNGHSYQGEDSISGTREENIRGKRKLNLPGIGLVILVAVVTVVFLYKKLHKSDWSEGLVSKEGKISLAVMPFRNLTNDTTWNIWQEGIQTSIASFLSNSEALKVMGPANELLQSQGLTDFAALTPLLEKNTAKRLDAAVYISGSIIQSDTAIRVTAQLINSGKGETIRSFETEGPASEGEIFRLVDTLRHQVNDFLIVTKLKRKDPNTRAYFFDPISSPEAYGYMVAAKKAEANEDPATAIEMYVQALKIDSTIYDAYSFIAFLYADHGDWESCRSWFRQYYSKYDNLNAYNKIYADYLNALLFKTPYEAIRLVEQMIALNDQAPYNFVNLGDEYYKLFQYDKAIPEYERALKIHKKWGTKPNLEVIYNSLGKAYHYTGQFRKEKKLYKKAESDFPDNTILMVRRAVLSLAEGDTSEATLYIRKCRTGFEKQSWSEAQILKTVAIIYSLGDYPDKAEEYYRKALSAEPGNTAWMNLLGFFFIDNDRNIEEGLGIIDKALILNPDDYSLLYSKGWGLYKKGRYSEALELSQRSWDLRIQNARYDHKAFLRLEEIKKAAAGQN